MLLEHLEQVAQVAVAQQTKQEQDLQEQPTQAVVVAVVTHQAKAVTAVQVLLL
jgi:hypothetical protein